MTASAPTTPQPAVPDDAPDAGGVPAPGRIDLASRSLAARLARQARLKAVGYAKATGEWVLAEDSGLVVPALKGRPGIYSARYAGTHGDDAANNRKLLKIFFSKHRRVRCKNVEKLRDHRANTTEMSGARFALKHTRQRSFLHKCGAIIKKHFPNRRPK